MALSTQRPLAHAVAAALALVLIAPFAAAQAPTTGTTSMRDQRAKRMAELGKEKQDKQEATQVVTVPARFPEATRVSPEAKTGVKMMKHLQALQELYEKQDMPGVIAKAEAIAAMPAANAYEKSYVYSMAANAAADQDDQAKAAEYFRKAVETNGLENDGHFGAMYNLGVIQFGLEKYQESLTTMERFLAETRSTKSEHRGFRAGILANLDRHDEAAKIYKELVAENPADKRLLMNAVAALQGADKFDQANLLLEDAHKRGMLTESRELRALYVGYMNAERWTDAQKVIDEGLARNVLQAGPDLARDYQVLAQNAYVDDKVSLATELYAKAAPMAADGEAYLNLAKVLDYAGKKAEAKAAAQKALDKGVKKPDQAKTILGR